MNVLSLFSGIGGIDLGLERAGMRTVAFCEREPAAQHWLREHWPEVPIFNDVCTLSGQSFRGTVDLIAGGFPCQPFSVAGRQKGTQDERHLWPHFARLIGEIRPRWVLAENVPGIRTIAADLVLEDLEKLGYTAWPLVVGADDVGAPHRRKRVWIVARYGRKIVAHRDGGGRRDERIGGLLDGFGASCGDDADGRGIRPVGEPTGAGLEGHRTDAGEPQEAESRHAGAHRWPARPGEPQHDWEAPRLAHTAKQSPRGARQSREVADSRSLESGMGNSADGLPRWMAGYTSAHRREALKALGNAVVPQVVEIIGRAIIEADKMISKLVK